MDPRIVSALVFWTHSGAYLLAIPVVAVSVVAVSRSRRELARQVVAEDEDLTRWHRRRAAGWSVTGLAGLLAFGIGFVHFGCAFVKSYDVQCTRNLKDLALEILMYAQDYDERFPPADRWADIPQLRGKDASMRCPAALTRFGYGMNSVVGCVSPAEVNEPYATVLLFEADAKVRSFRGGESDVAHGRHSGGENYCFCDGHAMWNGQTSRANLMWDHGPFRQEPQPDRPAAPDPGAVRVSP